MPRVRIERTPPEFQSGAQTVYATGAVGRIGIRPFTFSSIRLSGNCGGATAVVSCLGIEPSSSG